MLYPFLLKPTGQTHRTRHVLCNTKPCLVQYQYSSTWWPKECDPRSLEVEVTSLGIEAGGPPDISSSRQERLLLVGRLREHWLACSTDRLISILGPYCGSWPQVHRTFDWQCLSFALPVQTSVDCDINCERK